MSTKNKVIYATIAALFAQIIFGFSFMFSKTGLQYASPMVMIFNRYLVAFIGLSIVMLILKKQFRIKKNIGNLILMSLFQPLLYFICETYGIKMTTSSFSSIMISLIPVAAMILGAIILKEKPRFIQYIFALISVFGVIFIAMIEKEEGVVTTGGIILLLGAVFSSVLYNITSRKISNEFTAFERTYAMSIVGLVSFFLISVIENIKTPSMLFSAFHNPIYLISVLYLGVFSTIIAFLLLNYANTHISVAKTTVFSNLTTVVSVFAGVVFLKEPFTIKTLIAIVLIIAGVWGVQVLGVKEKNER